MRHVCEKFALGPVCGFGLFFFYLEFAVCIDEIGGAFLNQFFKMITMSGELFFGPLTFYNFTNKTFLFVFKILCQQL